MSIVKVEEVLDIVRADYDKFHVKGSNAAGTRLRKRLKEIMDICKDERSYALGIRKKRKNKI